MGTSRKPCHSRCGPSLPEPSRAAAAALTKRGPGSYGPWLGPELERLPPSARVGPPTCGAGTVECLDSFQTS